MTEPLESVRDLAQQCKGNKTILGKACPVFISTRWIYDYDIVFFILKYRKEIEEHTTIPYGIEEFYEILKVHKILIRHTIFQGI